MLQLYYRIAKIANVFWIFLNNLLFLLLLFFLHLINYGSIVQNTSSPAIGKAIFNCSSSMPLNKL